ncbi:hypothetical protein LIER_38275 [Lithospermum erythrorhizon]|uniref:GAG-pre-integrase domain-containing protein n=1 Tax=Lithospermum erythrorhizon TaxID=34254 RepID=A0AAV3PZU3_LITER
MSVEEYYNKLIGLFDELARLKPLHRCSCGHCTCNLVGRFQEDREEEKLHQFLVGVDDDLMSNLRLSSRLKLRPNLSMLLLCSLCLLFTDWSGLIAQSCSVHIVVGRGMMLLHVSSFTVTRNGGKRSIKEEKGASHHLTGILSCMTATRSIATCPIGLPDGHTTNATMEGRDQRSESLIGAGERKEGLYYYRRVPTVCAVTISDLSQFELWHRRLDHRHILNVARTFMFQGDLPIRFWGGVCPSNGSCY